MNLYVFMAVAMLALLGAAPASASCIYPEPPTSVPDGDTATYEEMVDAHRIIKEFDVDIRHFTVCLQSEAERVMQNPDLDEEEKQRVQQQLAELNDAAVDHAQLAADEFNLQLRKYRERNAQ